MEIKNKLLVGLLSGLLAFTGMACAADDAAPDAEVDVEGVETEEELLETESDALETEMEATEGATP